MPEQLLDAAQVGPTHDQLAGEGVPQIVEADIHNACPLACPPKAVINPVVGPSIPIAEHIRAFHMPWDPSQDICQLGIDRENSRLIVLCFGQRNRPRP